MNDIQRYSISGCGDTNCDPLIIDSDGPYVEYSDVKVIISERDQLKAENEALRQVMACVAAEIPRGYSQGNAPGHCHEVPGVWDRSNGEKSGRECGWCKVWNAAVAMSKEAAQ